jgi:hypothetical protein
MSFRTLHTYARAYTRAAVAAFAALAVIAISFNAPITASGGSSEQSTRTRKAKKTSPPGVVKPPDGPGQDTDNPGLSKNDNSGYTFGFPKKSPPLPYPGGYTGPPHGNGAHKTGPMPVPTPVPSSPVGPAQFCFPTCNTTDARFLVVPSGSAPADTFFTFEININLARNGAAVPKVEIFDGDTGGLWDQGTVPTTYEIWADTDANGRRAHEHGDRRVDAR